MHRFIFYTLISLWLLSACVQPARTYPRQVQTGLDSIEYAGYVDDARNLDLRNARFLAKFKVGDLGLSLDCNYSDALRKAKAMARKIGGNLVVVSFHQRMEFKSNCHRIKGSIYAVPNLAGLESQIDWHGKRPLQAGDLLGTKARGDNLPPLRCSIKCRILGDYFNEAIIHTETTFWADSSGTSADTAFSLRRAQLHFDLAELHARRLKAAIVALGRDLPAITGQYRGMLAKEENALRQQEDTLDGELRNSADKEAVFQRWQSLVQGELAANEQYFSDYLVDLHKKPRRQ